MSGRTRFEKHPAQVMFDPGTSSYVVTWAKCNLPAEKRLAAKRDPGEWLPSVAAMAALFDRGCIPQANTVFAAMAVGAAWDAGDRVQLDTEEAKKAAMMVRDLATMCADSSSQASARDIGQAMRHLVDEIAAVRFMNLAANELDESVVMPPLEKAAAQCFALDGFEAWPSVSMRRRFLFCLNRHERSPLAYTLIALLFGTGSCPLLSLYDRRAVRAKAQEMSGFDGNRSRQHALEFLRTALSIMRKAKAEGRSTMGLRMTQQQLSDLIMGSMQKTEDSKGE